MSLKVLVASLDDPAFPCARLRLLDPMACCPDVEVRWAIQRHPGGVGFRGELLEWAELIVTQRGLPQPAMRAVLDAISACRKPVIYETDDCLPEVPDFLDKPHYRQWGPDILAWAARVDAVTVPTQSLADYFEPHARRIYVLPNYLTSRTRPQSLASVGGAKGRVEIGYFGNPGHRGDLALVAGPLMRILERRPEVHVTFFGALPERFPVHDRVRVVPADFRYETFPRRLAALGFDFGLAPLVDNPFNRCVSPLKYLEYGALGIPGIFSRGPAYGPVRDGVTGLVCDASADTWEAAIDLLCRDPALRHRLGEGARGDVRVNWMLEPRAHLWSETYSSIVAQHAMKRDTA